MMVSPEKLKILESAVEIGSQFTDPQERDLATRSVILSSLIQQTRSCAVMEGVDDPASKRIIKKALETIAPKVNDSTGKRILAKVAKKDSRIAALRGAFLEDGTLSSFWNEAPPSKTSSEPQTFYELFLQAYYRNYGGLSLEQIQAAVPNVKDVQAELLQDDRLLYTNGLWYPFEQYCANQNGYELVESFQAEAAELIEEGLQQKLERQVNRLRDLLEANSRKVEEIPLTLSMFHPRKGWARLGILEAFLRMNVGGRYSLKTEEGDVYEIGENTKDSDYIVNAINGNKLTYDPSNPSNPGMNSQAGKDRIKEIEKDLREWIKSSEYRSEIEQEFNRRFNGEICSEYKSESFHIDKLTPPPGKSPHWYQWTDTRRFAQQGKGMSVYGVGVGKTLLGIMIGLTMLQMGKASKIGIVMPKTLVSNWKKEIDRWTTGVNYIIVGLEQVYNADGTPSRTIRGFELVRDRKTKLPVLTAEGNYQLRPLQKGKKKSTAPIIEMSPEEFLEKSEYEFREETAEEKLAKQHRIANNPYDFVLFWRETAKSIPLSPETELKYLKELVGRHFPKDENKKVLGKKSIAEVREDLLSAMSKQGLSTTIAQNYQEEEAAQNMATKLATLRGQKADANIITFEQLGIDCLIRDEAHDCCNLWSPHGRYEGVKGTKGESSQRAYDFYLKSRWIRETMNGSNVFLLTATPIRNSVLDLYTLLTMICDEELLSRKVATVDDFISVWGKVDGINVANMSGQIVNEQTLYGFQLLNELRSLVNKFCVVRLDGKKLGIMEPDEFNIHHVTPMTPEQSYLYSLLIKRLELGLELIKSREFKDFPPELRPLSVLADMDKLTLSVPHYLRSTIHGDSLDVHGMLLNLKRAPELQDPITSYRFQWEKTLEELAQKECAQRGLPLYHETRKVKIGEEDSLQPDFSDEYLNVKAELKRSDAPAKVLGTLGDFSEREFGWRCEVGVERSVLDVTYKLTEQNGKHRWSYVKGLPYHNDEMARTVQAVKKAVDQRWEVVKEVHGFLQENPLQDLQGSRSSQLKTEPNPLQDLQGKELETALQLIRKLKKAGKALSDAKEKSPYKPGDVVHHRGMTLELTSDYQFRRIDGGEFYDLTSPKLKRLAEIAKIYYHSGAITLTNKAGEEIISTPFYLFKDEDDRPNIGRTFEKWQSLAVGQAFILNGEEWTVQAIGPGNLVIFCDQTGSTGKPKKPLMYYDLVDVLVEAGIPSTEIELVYGDVKTEVRSRISDEYNNGTKRVLIGHTETMGEGLNLQGFTYPSTATIYLTQGWNRSKIDQGNGRTVRQGNRAQQVDIHFLLTERSIDSFRMSKAQVKGNIFDSVMGDNDELLLETDVPTLDEILLALSSDPIEAKKRSQQAKLLAELQQHKKVLRDRYKLLARMYNYLCIWKSKSAELGTEAWRKTQKAEELEYSIKNCLRVLRQNDGVEIIDRELLDFDLDGEIRFFPSPDRVIYRIGDIIRPHSYETNHHQTLFRIYGFDLNNQVVLVTGLEFSFNQHPSTYAIPFGVFNRENEKRRRYGFHIHSLQYRATHMVKADFSEGDLIKLIEKMRGYCQVTALLTPEEINKYRGYIINVLKKTAQTQSNYLVVQTDDGLDVVKFKQDTPSDIPDSAIVLPIPGDAYQEQEMCKLAFFHRDLFHGRSQSKGHRVREFIHALHPWKHTSYDEAQEYADRGKELFGHLKPTAEQIFAAFEAEGLPEQTQRAVAGFHQAVERGWGFYEIVGLFGKHPDYEVEKYTIRKRQ